MPIAAIGNTETIFLSLPFSEMIFSESPFSIETILSEKLLGILGFLINVFSLTEPLNNLQISFLLSSCLF